MAELVFAAGLSHSPLLAAPASLWLARGEEDRRNPGLYDRGRLTTFAELEAQRSVSLRPEIEPEVLEERSKQCQVSLDRLQGDLADARPDLVLIVGDDQRELFGPSNSPALALYTGETVAMCGPWPNGPTGPFWDGAWRAYGMDPRTEFPGAPREAVAVLEHLMTAGFDPAVCESPCGHGFGHAFGFPLVRLRGEATWRCLPVMLNTYYPPNQPGPGRCFDLGVALREAIDRLDPELRVAILASGGLSHFVVDEALDQEVLDALRTRDRARLSALPVEQLQAGSSEIRNWITVGGAVAGLEPVWSEYVPCYRSQAGTGCGMAFLTWAPAREER